MAEIRISGVRMGSEDYHVHLVVVETRVVDGQEVDVPIGEVSCTFPSGATLHQAAQALIEQARAVKAHHEQAAQALQALQQMEWPAV